MSAVGERNYITKLLKLGISDFLLKPFTSKDFVDRVGIILSKIQESGVNRSQSKSRNLDNSKQAILLGDNDLNFRAFFHSLYSNKFNILEAETGVDVLDIFIESKPNIVCLGKGLKIFAENLVAKKIRLIDRNSESSIYLCTENPDEDKENAISFDGIIRKSFVPKIFFSEFNAIVLGVKSIYESLIDIVKNHLKSEIISAIQQAIGVLTMQESTISVVPQTELSGEQYEAAIELRHSTSNVVITISMIGSKKDVEYLFERVVGSAPDNIESALDTLGELVNTISGRIRQSLDNCGFMLDSLKQNVGIVDTNTSRGNNEMQVLINCSDSAKYVFSISIQKGNE